MALDVTVAGDSADSYATLIEAAAILDWKIEMGAAPEWAAGSDDAKEACLREGAKRLDREYYIGAKSDSDQALRFPSGHHTDSAGDLELREHIKRGQVFLSLALMEDPGLFDGSGVSRVAVTGSFQVDLQGERPSTLPDDVLAEMQPELFKTSPGTGKTWDSARRGFV